MLPKGGCCFFWEDAIQWGYLPGLEISAAGVGAHCYGRRHRRHRTHTCVQTVSRCPLHPSQVVANLPRAAG
jgi:hypothetical protein